MARSPSLRLAALALSNILLPIAVLVFATGFFPYKPFLPGLATFEDVREPRTANNSQAPLTALALPPDPVFNRVVFMVVDALRSDFVYGYNSGFSFTQRYTHMSISHHTERYTDPPVASSAPALPYPLPPTPLPRPLPCRA